MDTTNRFWMDLEKRQTHVKCIVNNLMRKVSFGLPWMVLKYKSLVNKMNTALCEEGLFFIKSKAP